MSVNSVSSRCAPPSGRAGEAGTTSCPSTEGLPIQSVTNQAATKPASHRQSAGGNAERAFIPKDSFSSEAAFDQHMNAQLKRWRGGEKLSELETNQLNAWRSNANYLFNQITKATQTSRQLREIAPYGHEAKRVRKLGKPIHAIVDHSAGKSVFTRDVDFRELQGLLKSKRLLSANERQLNGFGRIRKFADFNRGGAMGTYTRVVSENRIRQAEHTFLALHPEVKHYSSQHDATLAPLGVGSVGNAGITIVIDAKAALREISHPLELWHNDRDSAGRILGRIVSAAGEREGAKVGRGSERFIGHRNPLYYKREDVDRHYSLKPLNIDKPAKIASRSHQQLQAIMESPRVETDHNEQVWLTPPSLAKVKAVFIQKQLDRPPRLLKKTSEEIRTEKEKNRRKMASIREKISQLTQRRKQGILSPTELILRNAPLLSQLRKCTEPLCSHHIVDQRARLPKEVRVPSFWKDGNIPEGYRGLTLLKGVDGTPLSELITHVSPGTKRADLPRLADEVLNRAKDRGRAGSTP